MKASVKFSTNLFFTDELKISYDSEGEFSFKIRNWLIKELDRNKYTLHLYPNGNFSIELYPEVIFIGIIWNDYELKPEIEHWCLFLEKENYPNPEVNKHADSLNSKRFFIEICHKINIILKNEPKITEICWSPTINLMNECKLFTEICPDEN